MTRQGTHLIAEDGKALYNARFDIYSTSVFLGVYDSISNWVEVEAPHIKEEVNDDVDYL